ncbi:type I restriction enzyme subunit R domain-containing protein, partial [Mycoplasmopsis bovis]|uniref:type I restriction enzyme subunit R domain-containing protein n=1 Tax=Mycoplasmopsis bovis TaxID=28903 RepID=UPI003D2B530A
MAFENLIQAISRTNRNYNANLKPYGNVVFFKQPGRMKWNMQEALAEYADFDPGMAMPKSFVNKLLKYRQGVVYGQLKIH